MRATHNRMNVVIMRVIELVIVMSMMIVVIVIMKVGMMILVGEIQIMMVVVMKINRKRVMIVMMKVVVMVVIQHSKFALAVSKCQGFGRGISMFSAKKKAETIEFLEI